MALGLRLLAKAPLLIQEGRRDRGGGGYKRQAAGVVTSGKPQAWLQASNRGGGYQPQTAGVVTSTPGWLALSQMPADLPQNPFRVFEHVTVFKPQHTDVPLLQAFRPATIVFPRHGIEMGLPVKLHRQAALGAVEIQDIRSYAVLSAELFAAHLGPLKSLPQGGFGRGQ